MTQTFQSGIRTQKTPTSPAPCDVIDQLTVDIDMLPPELRDAGNDHNASVTRLVERWQNAHQLLDVDPMHML